MSLPKPPTSVKYFFGRISRDEAENELNMRGCTEGLYLLRESMTTAGNYALSICHQGRYVLSVSVLLLLYLCLCCCCFCFENQLAILKSNNKTVKLVTTIIH